MRHIRFTFMLINLLVICCFSSCSVNKEHEVLDCAESLMESLPDSALILLEGVDKADLGSKKLQARYAILMSMALDKNHVDRTDFEVLQPAIEYYLENGDANEKLRTYYYQGRIYQNRGERDSALSSFTKAVDISSDSNDSLCLARALVAQGAMYDDFYDFENYSNCNLRAAEIYKNMSYRWHEFDCLVNALNGAISAGDKVRCESILDLCDKYKPLDSIQAITLNRYRLSFAMRFKDFEAIPGLVEILDVKSNTDSKILLNLAMAHNIMGDNLKASHLLDNVRNRPYYDKLKYLAISVTVFEDMGRYEEALVAYKEFSAMMDSINTLRFEQKAISIEDKHRLELNSQIEAREKNKIIWKCVGGIIFLIMIVIILFLLFRSNKGLKDLALERAKISELENERLKSEKDIAIRQAEIKALENERLISEREKLALENKNLQLEMDKKTLEAENLAHRVEQLENESATLKEVMDSQEELPSEVQQAIKVRIEMLNALMAGYITANDQYEKPYETWIKELTDNTEEFMNSNRLAFQASHPRFIQYFEDHGLTVGELNYVCLYAIGLRGKEVGNYMKMRSHVNISSGIRKKLGIDRHATNIGIYVRKLLKEL